MADIDEGDTESGGGSGAALVYPLEAGQVRKGAMAMLKGNPCKVVDYRSVSTPAPRAARSTRALWRTPSPGAQG